MEHGLKPYPTYKDSGVPWLGEVPEHWDLHALWTVSRTRAERNPGGLPLLSVFLDRGVIPYDQGGGQVHAPSLDLSNYQVVFPGDFVLNNQQAWRGSVGVSRYHGIISPAYIVLCLTGRLNSSFANYLMRSPRMVDQFVAASKGVGNIQRQIYWPYLRCVQVPVPSPDEQATIVRYLDYVCGRIDRFIWATRKLIALLNEQKQAIIHRAVTRGLDPNARLKASGVEWVEGIPVHWESVPNRAVLRLQKRLVGKASSDYVLLSLTKGGIVARDMDNPEGKWPASFDTYQEVNPGDLVFCLFDIDETPRTVGLSTLRGMITGAYTRFSCDPETAEWVYLFYLAMDDAKRLKPLYTGLRKVITKETFLRAKLPLPPPSERAAILAHVHASTDTTQQTIDRAEREIALLHEYRTRLIADVVTGKLDVREAAAGLPEHTHPVEEIEPDEAADGPERDEDTDGAWDPPLEEDL